LMVCAFVSTAYSQTSVVSFIYSGGSFTALPVSPGATNVEAFGMNNAGQIVGRYNAGGSAEGFLYSGGIYTPLAVPGFTSTDAYGISNRGQIVGTAYNNFSSSGFLYSGGSYTNFAMPGSINTNAYGINNSGQIVGTYSTAPGAAVNSFLYSGGIYTTIAVPGATVTQAYGINDAGQVVGNYYDGTGHIFLYSGGTYTTLSYPGTGGDPFGINNRGQFTGYFFGSPCSSIGGSDCGFLYNSATMTYMALRYPGAQFTFANGINDAGQIAGYAEISNVPLPAALPLFATGLGALGLLGWRRKRENAANAAT
jgi:uncharacterized membrane protein